MKSIATVAALVAAFALSGCATIMEGSDQQIDLTVSPPNVACTGMRDDRWLFRLQGAGVITVSKSRRTIDLSCGARGFETVVLHIGPQVSAWGITSAVVADFGITDLVTGAMFKYPAHIDVRLVPYRR